MSPAPSDLTPTQTPRMHLEEQYILLSPTSENEKYQPTSLYYDEKAYQDDGYWSDSGDETPAIGPIDQVVLGSAQKHPTLISYDELPEWYQDNPFILHGYRPVSKSTSVSLRSWLYFHNETVNIYSHLIPGILFLLLEIFINQWIHVVYPNINIGDHLVFAFYLLTVAICLFLSTSYHTVMNHSKEVESIFLKLDFVGIIVLTGGSLVSVIYFWFYCDRRYQIGYWSMILTLCAMNIFFLLSPKFQGLKWRTFRLGAFLATGFSSFAPLIHGFVIFGAPTMWDLGMAFYLIEGAMFLIGAAFYSKRIPETLKSFQPGTFDFLASSHQIFHILVVVAIIFHTLSLVVALRYNQSSRVCL